MEVSSTVSPKMQGVSTMSASESDEGAAEGADWDECYGVKMSPANPRYVGRGDNTCGGEVVYTIPEIKVLLRPQPDDAQRWLTMS